MLKTELSYNEKVSLINETSNQLFVQNIINIFAVAIISILTALFYVENFASFVKDV
jgi:hypothetical protein